MKKLISLALAVILCLGACISFASCGEKTDYTVGICQLMEHTSLDQATKGFKDALTAELKKAGKTVTIKTEVAGEATLCSTVINTFTASKVDLIMANATPALTAAAEATSTIPVLGTSVTSYEDTFKNNIPANVSGTSDAVPFDEQAQMMIDTLGLKSGDKVGLLYCSSEPNSQYQVDVVDEYLSGKGITVTHYKFNDSNDLQGITASAADACDAIYVPTDNTAASNTSIINNVCEAKKVPVFTGEENTCKGCGYATLAISYENIGRKTGEMAAKILLGQSDITTMAIEYDADPVKRYNEAACINLGIDIEALKAAGYVVIPGTEAE